jgi:hypothetical protein
MTDEIVLMWFVDGGIRAKETKRTREYNKRLGEREMCLWAISKCFGDLVSNTSA